jgi:hypothetical protein
MDWVILYGDGTEFSSDDGAPQDSPVWGAIGIAQPNLTDSDRHLTTGDYFIYRTDREAWHQIGTDGLDDHLCHFAHLISAVRKGRWVPSVDYRPVWKWLRRMTGEPE